MKIGTCDNLVQQNWILTAIVEYDMHCMYITSHDMLPRKLKDLIGDQAEDNDDDDHDGYRAAFSHLISHL